MCLTSVAQTNAELRDSLATLSAQLARDPQSIDLRLRKAGLNLRLEQWEYARNEYDYILERNPDNVSALYFRAYANERIGRYNFARKDYETLLTIVPGHYEAQLGLALVNQKDKHYTEALDMLNVLCSSHPERSEGFAARGGIEAERGLLELAEYDFRQALQLEPDNIDYHISHIDILLQLNRKEEARASLDALVRRGVPRPNLEQLYIRTKR